MDLAGVDSFMAIFGFHRVQGDKMNAGMKPVADRDDILTTFEELIDESGSTTTLDVKEALREDGFWIKQSDVSDVITQFVDGTNDYTFTIDRNHRVYEKAGTSFAPSLPSYVKKPKAVQKVSDWAVTDGTSTVVYTGMTRNQARYQFSKVHNTAYVDVRAIVLW